MPLDQKHERGDWQRWNFAYSPIRPNNYIIIVKYFNLLWWKQLQVSNTWYRWMRWIRVLSMAPSRWPSSLALRPWFRRISSFFKLLPAGRLRSFVNWFPTFVSIDHYCHIYGKHLCSIKVRGVQKYNFIQYEHCVTLQTMNLKQNQIHERRKKLFACRWVIISPD